MKSIIFAVAGFATTVVAQGVSDLAQCGQTCANNMLGEEKSTELGCSTGDLSCLCANPNFLYGIRDCSNTICGSSEASQAIQYGIQICQGAGVAISTSGGSNGGSTKTGSGSSKGGSVTVSTIFSVVTSDGTAVTTAVATTTLGSGSGDDNESKSGASGSGKVSTFTRVVTNSAGDKVTTIGETIVSGSDASKTDDVVLTTFTSGDSTVVATVTSTDSNESDSASKTGSETGSSSATATEDSNATGTDSSSSETSSSSSDNSAMPQMTAAPIGVIAAAGLALFLI